MGSRHGKRDQMNKKKNLHPKIPDGSVKAASRPHWDDTINDLTVHKLTSGDVARRKAGRVPRPSQMRCSTANSRPNTANSKSSQKFESTKEELLCEMFANKGRLLSVLKQSDKTVTVVRNSFQDCKRFRGLPNITRAPKSPGSEPCGVLNAQLNDGVSSNSENDLTEELRAQLENQSHVTAVTDRPRSDCNDESEEEVDIDFEKEIRSRVETESASRRSQRQEMHEKISPGSAASISKKSDSSGGKPFRMLKLGAENAAGDVFDSLDKDNDVTHFVAPIVDRTRHQVEDLKKLVDALTLELISTNDRYNSLAEEFHEYKEKNERKMSALEEVVRSLVMRMEQVHMSSNSESVELVTDLKVPNPESDDSFDDSNESGDETKPVCRQEILAQLEELQRQRDLAQAQLQTIANL